MSLRQESLGEDSRINSGPGESESWVGLGIIWDDGEREDYSIIGGNFVCSRFQSQTSASGFLGGSNSNIRFCVFRNR